jgi:hypothetical protein
MGIIRSMWGHGNTLRDAFVIVGDSELGSVMSSVMLTGLCCTFQREQRSACNYRVKNPAALIPAV